jgi:hypothetical protein
MRPAPLHLFEEEELTSRHPPTLTTFAEVERRGEVVCLMGVEECLLQKLFPSPL